jgi:hypothetical protein
VEHGIKISFTLSQPIEIQSEFSSTGVEREGKNCEGGVAGMLKSHSEEEQNFLFIFDKKRGGDQRESRH